MLSSVEITILNTEKSLITGYIIYCTVSNLEKNLCSAKCWDTFASNTNQLWLDLGFKKIWAGAILQIF